MRKPCEPTKPSPVPTTKWVVLGAENFLGEDTTVVLASLPAGTEQIEVNAYHDDGDTDICLKFVQFVPLDDAEQETCNKRYERNLQAYKLSYAKYVEENEIYDAWLTHETERQQREQYETLKKIYEPSN